jgi:hypothetical protein
MRLLWIRLHRRWTRRSRLTGTDEGSRGYEGACGFGLGVFFCNRISSLLAPEIVFVISRIDFYFAVADFEHARGQLVDEIAVVRNEDDRARVLHQRFEQDIFGAQVEVVGGLVEQQEVGGMQQHFQQRVAIALASGEHADALEDIVSRKKKTAEQAAQLGLRRGGRKFAEIVENARFRIEFLVLVLREVVEMNFVAELVFAGTQLLLLPRAA